MTTQETPPEATGTPPVEPGTDAADAAPEGTPTEPVEGAEPDGHTFTLEYVKKLREENAASRIKAARADTAETRLRALAIEQAVSEVLMSPDDLSWSAELADENGFPDHDKILAAAEALVARKPHLARVRGDVGQGQRGDAVPAVSLSGLLRAGA